MIFLKIREIHKAPNKKIKKVRHTDEGRYLPKATELSSKKLHFKISSFFKIEAL